MFTHCCRYIQKWCYTLRQHQQYFWYVIKTKYTQHCWKHVYAHAWTHQLLRGVAVDRLVFYEQAGGWILDVEVIYVWLCWARPKCELHSGSQRRRPDPYAMPGDHRGIRTSLKLGDALPRLTRNCWVALRTSSPAANEHCFGQRAATFWLHDLLCSRNSSQRAIW